MQEMILKILDSYPPEQRFSLAVMQDMQRSFGYIPREGLLELSLRTRRPLSALYAMASFYKSLSLSPKGKYIIRVCDGTACHLKGSSLLLDNISGTLGISPGETTGDGLFTLETVACIGACSIAPAVMIGERYYGKVTIESLSAILAEYRVENEIGLRTEHC